MIIHESTAQVEPEPRDFTHPNRQHQPLRLILAALRRAGDDLDAREALREMERRHDEAHAATKGVA